MSDFQDRQAGELRTRGYLTRALDHVGWTYRNTGVETYTTEVARRKLYELSLIHAELREFRYVPDLAVDIPNLGTCAVDAKAEVKRARIFGATSTAEVETATIERDAYLNYKRINDGGTPVWVCYDRPDADDLVLIPVTALVFATYDRTTPGLMPLTPDGFKNPRDVTSRPDWTEAERDDFQRRHGSGTAFVDLIINDRWPVVKLPRLVREWTAAERRSLGE